MSRGRDNTIRCQWVHDPDPQSDLPPKVLRCRCGDTVVTEVFVEEKRRLFGPDLWRIAWARHNDSDTVRSWDMKMVESRFKPAEVTRCRAECFAERKSLEIAPRVCGRRKP